MLKMLLIDINQFENELNIKNKKRINNETSEI